MSDAKGLVQTISILKTTGIEGAEFVNVTVGLGEVNLDLSFDNFHQFCGYLFISVSC